jgi:hypothetical protein
MYGTGVRQAPDAAAAAGRRHFGIAMTASIEKILRPPIDRMGAHVAAMND